MNHYSETGYQEDLRDKARAIVSFKMHRTVFILANILIWLICIFLYYAFEVTWVWAIFPTAIWAVILAFHYLWIFKWNKDRVEKEYQKLLAAREKQMKRISGSETSLNQNQ